MDYGELPPAEALSSGVAGFASSTSSIVMSFLTSAKSFFVSSMISWKELVEEAS